MKKPNAEPKIIFPRLVPFAALFFAILFILWANVRKNEYSKIFLIKSKIRSA